MSADRRLLTVVEDDLATKTADEVSQEMRVIVDRAERVRRRLTMNQAFLPPVTPPDAAEQAKQPDVS